MQVRDTTRDIESTFESKKNKFQIEASSKAFQILSSNLYTDKPLAIIRELCCNALDAHWEAKNENPFQVILPNSLNPSLEIRDFGTGMSPEKVEKLYMTFFASDKNKTNDAIGGLGLGSKTPFSYTDTFTLISFWEGKKYTWLCFIDEEGEPATQRVNEEETEELNGIHYIIPIKSEDFSTFRNKARQVLRYFPDHSYDINTDITYITYTLKNDVYGIREEQNYSDRIPRIIMGPVAYRLDKSALDGTVQDKYSTLLGNKPIDIFCDIGDVDVQASREALSYDKRSQAQIEDVLQIVVDRIRTDIEKELAGCDTFLEACCKAKSISNSFGGMSYVSNVKWKGKKLIMNYSLKDGVVVNESCITESYALRIKYPSYSQSVNIEVIKGAEVMLYDSIIANSNKKLKAYLLKNPNKQIILFRDEQAMFSFMWEMELFTHTAVEDLPMPEEEEDDPVYTTARRKSAPVKMKIRNSGGNWEALEKSIEDLNERENTCWAPLEGGGNEPWKYNDHYTMYKALINSKIPVTVIGIPKTLSHKVKHLTIPNIEEYTRYQMIERIGTEERLNMAFVARAELDYLGDIAAYTSKRWEHLEFVQFAKKHTDLHGLRFIKDVAETFFDWKLTKSFSLIIEGQYKHRYKIFRVLDNIYHREQQFISDAFDLLHGEDEWHT